MRNILNIELKGDIRDLINEGYSKKDGVKILISYGYCQSTARNYWDLIAGKLAQHESKDALHENTGVKNGME